MAPHRQESVSSVEEVLGLSPSCPQTIQFYPRITVERFAKLIEMLGFRIKLFFRESYVLFSTIY